MRALITTSILCIAVTGLETQSYAENYECYWVEGRLRAYNGTPSFRIWPRNTNRLLGVVSRTGNEDEIERLPSSVRELAPNFGKDIWGEFQFCPTVRERKGWMRFGYVTAARNLAVLPN